MQVLTAAEMRALEADAMSTGRATGLELMERAGRGVLEAVFAEWPDLAPVAAGGNEYLEREEGRKALVLCGPGNNGGDGFVIARLLRALGWDVAVYLYGRAGALPPDAARNYERWILLGPVAPLTEATWEQSGFPGPCDLVVDALFGIGLSRAIALPLETLSAQPELGQSHKLVAVDVPSGLDADRGDALGDLACQVHADLTVTFHALKHGHVLRQGPTLCGKVVVKDIGLQTDEAPGPGRPEVF